MSGLPTKIKKRRQFNQIRKTYSKEVIITQTTFQTTRWATLHELRLQEKP